MGSVGGPVQHGHAVGGRLSHEYRCWAMMKQRCLNPKATNYNRYGGAGVTVHETWLSFGAFLADMGAAPSASHSLDRFPEKSGNYEPRNVRWATKREQTENRRPAKQRTSRHRAALSAALQGKPWTAARRAAQKGCE